MATSARLLLLALLVTDVVQEVATQLLAAVAEEAVQAPAKGPAVTVSQLVVIKSGEGPTPAVQVPTGVAAARVVVVHVVTV